jgi:hypothetical protein
MALEHCEYCERMHRVGSNRHKGLRRLSQAPEAVRAIRERAHERGVAEGERRTRGEVERLRTALDERERTLAEIGRMIDKARGGGVD